ncbi:MAG: hypothetical protein ACI4OX_02780 [Akkermansia sp.]
MKQKKEIIEKQTRKMFTEMATVARDYENNLSIVVNPNPSRNRPTYFKVYDHANYRQATKCAGISFLSPEYVIRAGEEREWKFSNKKEKRLLINFLNSKRRGKKDTELRMTNWQYTIALWNVEMGFIDDAEEAWAYTMENTNPHDADFPLPIDLPMPDYTLLQ